MTTKNRQETLQFSIPLFLLFAACHTTLRDFGPMQRIAHWTDRKEIRNYNWDLLGHQWSDWGGSRRLKHEDLGTVVQFDVTFGITRYSGSHRPEICALKHALKRVTDAYSWSDHLPSSEQSIFILSAVKSSERSSTVGILKIRHWSPGCGFVWIPKVVYFPIKHSCVYLLDTFIEEIYNPFLSFFIFSWEVFQFPD